MVAHFIKILLDTFENLLGSIFAKALNKPRFGVSVVFTAVTGLANGKHIGRDSAGAIGKDQGNEVISGQFGGAKKALLIAAIRTTVVPITESVRPVLFGEGGWTRKSAATPSAIGCLNFVGIRPRPAHRTSTGFFRVGFAPAVDSLSNFLRVFEAIEFCLFSVLFAMLFPGASVNFAHSFWVLESPFQICFSSLLRVFSVIGAPSGLHTYLASTCKTGVSSFVAIEEFQSRQIPNLTFSAALEEIRGIDHDVSPSSYLGISSADGEICRRFGLQSLADERLLYHKYSVDATKSEKE